MVLVSTSSSATSSRSESMFHHAHPTHHPLALSVNFLLLFSFSFPHSPLQDLSSPVGIQLRMLAVAQINFHLLLGPGLEGEISLSMGIRTENGINRCTDPSNPITVCLSVYPSTCKHILLPLCMCLFARPTELDTILGLFVWDR